MKIFCNIIIVDNNQKKDGTVMEKKNVVIYVAGQRFSISTSDTPEYVLGIGEKIDVMIKGIQKDNPKLNRDACAILTALNICDDETKLRQMMEVLRGQVKDYLDANEKLRAENDALKEELKALKENLPANVADPAQKTEQKNTEEMSPSPITVTLKSEEAVANAVQRQMAFSGKNFSSDRHKNKKNKHKHHNQNNSFAPANPPAPAAAASSANDADEAQAEAASPFHQFSIFDDLI